MPFLELCRSCEYYRLMRSVSLEGILLISLLNRVLLFLGLLSRDDAALWPAQSTRFSCQSPL